MRASAPLTVTLDFPCVSPRFLPQIVTMAPSSPAFCPREVSELPLRGPLVRSEKHRLGSGVSAQEDTGSANIRMIAENHVLDIKGRLSSSSRSYGVAQWLSLRLRLLEGGISFV